MKLKSSLISSWSLLVLMIVPIVNDASFSLFITKASAETIAGVQKTITPNHKELDQAIEAAKKAGITINQDKQVETKPTTYDKLDQDSKEISDSYQQKIKEINTAVKEYQDQLDLYNQKIEEIKKEPKLADKNGVTVYGSYNQSGKGSLAYYKNIHVVIDEKQAGEDAALAESIQWGQNTKVENISMKTGDKDLLFSDLAKDQQFKITNVGKTNSGKNLNIIATVTKTPGKVASAIVDEDGNIIRDDIHGISISKGSEGDFDLRGIGYQDYPLNFKFVDDAGEEVKVVTAVAIGDIDNAQGLSTTFGNVTTLNPTESLLTQDGNSFSADNDKMSAFEESNDINGFNQAPVGTIGVVGLGTNFDYSHINADYGADWNGHYHLLQWNLFGSAFTLDTIVKPLSPKIDYQLLSLTYQTEDLNIEPQKDVEMTVGGGSINDQEIKKGQKFNYLLKSSYYPVNRDQFKSWKMTDDYDQDHDQYNRKFAIHAVNKNGVIQKDTEFDKWLQTNQDNILEVIDKDGKLIFTAQKDLIEYFNTNLKDKEIAFAIYPEFTRIKAGDVENTVVETFNENNETSNTVITHTPDRAPDIKIKQKTNIENQVESSPKQLANTGSFDPKIPALIGASGVSIVAIAYYLISSFKKKD